MSGKVRFFGEEVNGALVEVTKKVDESVSKVMYLEQTKEDLEAEVAGLQKEKDELAELLSVSDGELREVQQLAGKLAAELASTRECREAERKDMKELRNFLEGLVGIRDRFIRLIHDTRLQPKGKRISNKKFYRLLVTAMDPTCFAEPHLG